MTDSVFCEDLYFEDKQSGMPPHICSITLDFSKRELMEGFTNGFAVPDNGTIRFIMKEGISEEETRHLKALLKKYTARIAFDNNN